MKELVMVKNIRDFILKHLVLINIICFFILMHRNLDLKNMDSYMIVGFISEIAGMIIAFRMINFIKFSRAQKNNNLENQ